MRSRFDFCGLREDLEIGGLLAFPAACPNAVRIPTSEPSEANEARLMKPLLLVKYCVWPFILIFSEAPQVRRLQKTISVQYQRIKPACHVV